MPAFLHVWCYGLDKRGQDVAILYLGNSVTGERHYHIMGPMRYGERLFGNADFHVFLQQDLLPLVGDEANIALPETVKIGEKLLTIELRNKL
ncbi:MAG: hypothetical protein KJ706_00085 [Candidatus Omnitrophica bacterium]|nr:hypothetical protein [Candidatus Omnitrophota bacterium]